MPLKSDMIKLALVLISKVEGKIDYYIIKDTGYKEHWTMQTAKHHN